MGRNNKIVGWIMFTLMIIGFFADNMLFVEHSMGGLIALIVLEFLNALDRKVQ